MSEVKESTNKNSRTSLFLVLLVFLCFSAFAPALQAAQVTLAWDPNPEPSVAGYRVYYGTASGVYTNVVDAGCRTDITITDLAGGRTYFFSATAYSTAGDESGFSAEVIYTTGGQSSASDSGNTLIVKCFIATAAYGGEFAPEVTALRAFRDRCLLNHRPGRAFVDWYYSVSPPIAAFISEHEALKTAVRLGLAPVVFAVRYPAAAGVLVCAVIIGLAMARRSTRMRHIRE